MNVRHLLLGFLVLVSLAGCNSGRRSNGTTALPDPVAAAVLGGGPVLLDPLAARVLLGTILLQNSLAVGVLGGDIRFRLLLTAGYEADEDEYVLAPGEERSVPIYTTDVTLAALQILVVANYVQTALERQFTVAWTNESANARSRALLELIVAGPLAAFWYSSALLAPIGVLTRNSNPLVPQRLPASPQEVALYGALTCFLLQARLAEAFGEFDGGVLFPPGAGAEGFTVVAQPSAPMVEGDHCCFWLETAGDIPLADPDQRFQYAFVVDSDTDPANNWVPVPAFPDDFFGGTDRWYELDYTPANGWSLRCRVVGPGNALSTVASGARAILSGNTLLMVVPRSEFVVANPPFRASTFAHLGDFGQNPPYTWSGDPTPTVAEGLRSWQ